MNEVRKELEKQFKAFGLFEPEDKPAETKSETEETLLCRVQSGLFAGYEKIPKKR